jgi:SAM-dependent methyltransferase
MNENNHEITPITMPGVHERFYSYFTKKGIDKDIRILDIGAGHGAFSKKLYDDGYRVSACDLFPEHFKFDRIDCKKVNITEEFPYPDNSFDLVIAIEVSEHIIDHEVFFKECNRILKPRGEIYLSTPNILSLKSRMRFLFSGFFYSFNPLELKNYDGLQHVASLTLDQYNYVAVKYGFSMAEYDIDRKQSTSRWLYFFLFPFIWLFMKIKSYSDFHNQKKLLMGRLLFLNFRKHK